MPFKHHYSFGHDLPDAEGDSIDFVSRDCGTTEEPYLEIKLENVLVSSYSVGGGGDSAPVETGELSLNYAAVE